MKPGDEIIQPVHEHVLKQGEILQIEYMTNLWNIGSDTCQLIALPLNTPECRRQPDPCHRCGGRVRKQL